VEIITEKMTIVQGEIIDLPLTILQSDCKPFDLTPMAEVKFCISNIDGGIVEKKLTDGDVTIDDARLGELTVRLSSVDTNSLEVKENQSFDVKVLDNADESLATVLRVAKFTRLLDVEKGSC
jgi:hypothetical protein